MRQRAVVINSVLGAGILAVGVVSYVLLHGSSAPAATTGRTTTVQRGTVTATVAGSGNASSATTTALTFSGCSGTLRSLAVKVGSTITIGEQLASVDTTTNALALQTAQLSYNGAQTSRQDALTQADNSVTSAQSNYTADVTQAQNSVTAATNAVTSDQTKVADAQTTYNLAGAMQKASALSALNQAQSQLVDDQTKLSDAQTQLSSTATKDNAAISSAQTAQSEAQTDSSQSALSLRNAQLALTQAQQNLAGCTLISPRTGTVTAISTAVGGSVTGTSSASTSGSTTSGSSTSGSTTSGSTSTSSTGTTTTGTTTTGTTTSGSTTTGATTSSTGSAFITVVDMTHLQVATSFSESDIASVKVGQAATVLFAALPSSTSTSGTTVDGTVTEIDPTSTVSSNVVSYGVTISLTSPPAALRLGQTGTVTVTTATKTDALYVLTSAITTRGGRKTVEVQNGTQPTATTVTTGAVGNSTTEILTGLTEGQTLVIPTTTNTSTSTTNGGIPGGAGGLTGVGR